MLKNPWFIQTWKEGKYIDPWSFIHLIDGMFLAGIVLLIGFNFLIGFLIALAIILIWELIEPPEALTNKILDVLISVIGFFFMYFIYSMTLFIVVSILAISLNFWAWIITGNYKIILEKFKNKIFL